MDRADWKQYVAALADAGKLAHRASQARNFEAFVDISEKLNDACANCHKVYRDKGRRRGERSSPMSVSREAGGNHAPDFASAPAALILRDVGRLPSPRSGSSMPARTDLFGVNFPGEPKVQDIAYADGIRHHPAGHVVYSADSGPSRYSVTVVDYADAEKIHTARVEQCQEKGGEGDACHERLAGRRAGLDRSTRRGNSCSGTRR